MEVSSGFPAPPVGACLKLAKRVSTQARESDGDLDFYERKTSSHSGEFTDAKRFFFVLEPPLPPEPEPDTNAIRAAIEKRQRAADAELYRSQGTPIPTRRKASPPRQMRQSEQAAPGSVVARFQESVVCTFERWHDGIGYDLELLKSATKQERAQIESLLISQPVADWRDVEALVALNSPRTRAALKRAFPSADLRTKIAMIDYAQAVFSEAKRIAVLVIALEQAETCGGLTQALLIVEGYHPAPIIDALLGGVLRRNGATAGRFAAMLMFLHGKAESPFDWAHRPFLLRFQEGDRGKLFRELCGRMGLNKTEEQRIEEANE